MHEGGMEAGREGETKIEMVTLEWRTYGGFKFSS